jgi:thiamine biosynthesis lipoprotein
MNTIVEITVARPFPEGYTTVWHRTDSLLKDWEEKFSPQGSRSEIQALNYGGTECLKVSHVAYAMIKMGRAYGDTTAGMFDITIFPVKKIWGMCDNDTGWVYPSEADFFGALEKVDYHKIHTDSMPEGLCVSCSGAVVDVGGIAKGFALRALDSAISRMGFVNYLVSAGGDIVARGKKPDGKTWKIGIQHPRKTGKLLAAVEITEGSVVTSGDYERYRIHNGQRIHHIFNPHTGLSCTANQSVTIWGMDPAEIDIFTTGLFCRPAADIVAFVEKRKPRFECMVVDSAGEIFISEGWKQKISLVEQKGKK